MALDRIDLDHAATTPLRPEARDAMLPWLDHANPSSSHASGRRARAQIDRARETLACVLGVDFAEIAFCATGTEAVQSAILGAALGAKDPRRTRVLMSAAEHACARETAPLLTRLGYRVEWLPVTPRGTVTAAPDDLSDVLLVVAMGLNNELGTANDLASLHARCRQAGVLLFADHVQTLGKAPLIVPDLCAVASHKIGGPMGAAAFVVRGGVPWSAWTPGAQERERRGGTENVAALAGFEAALRVMDSPDRLNALGARLREILRPLGAELTVPDPDAPSIAHCRFPGRSAETMLIALDRVGVAASAGAACSSGAVEPSPVLGAIGWDAAQAKEGLRFSVGWSTTADEIEEAGRRIATLL